MDTLSGLFNFILWFQSPERLNHLLKITLQISSIISISVTFS